MSIWLVMQTSDGTERTFAVQKSTTVIGRETSCDVRVPVPTVSQKHCQLTLEEGERLRITDLHSERGTFHNGNRVEEAMLAHEDKVTIGPVTFVVRVQREAAAQMSEVQSLPEIVIERQPPTKTFSGPVA